MSGRRSGPVVWCAIVLATCLLLYLLQHMLWLTVPFLLGIILYYVLLPPMHRLLRMGFSHNTAALLVGSGFFACVIVAGLLLMAWLSSSPSSSWQGLPERYIEGGTAFVRNTLLSLEDKFPVLHQAGMSDNINARFSAYTHDFFTDHLPGLLVGAAAWIPSLLLAPFLTFFFLRDGGRFKRFLARAVPNAFFEKTLFLLHEVDQTARRYFQGMLKLTVLDTAVLAFGLWLIGVSSPLLLGFIAAVLAWIPFVGSILGCIMVVLVAAADAPGETMIAYSAIGVFIAARLLDDFLFMPLTLGRSLRIHPLVTVLMIFIGGSVAGVAGLMLVLPLLGVVMVIGETLGRLITNPRLRARHRHAKALRQRQASADLLP